MPEINLEQVGKKIIPMAKGKMGTVNVHVTTISVLREWSIKWLRDMENDFKIDRSIGIKAHVEAIYVKSGYDSMT